MVHVFAGGYRLTYFHPKFKYETYVRERRGVEKAKTRADGFDHNWKTKYFMCLFYYYWNLRARRHCSQFTPIFALLLNSFHTSVTVQYHSHWYPRWWGGPRDRAAMGLEPTTPHRVLRGAAGASAQTTRPPAPPPLCVYFSRVIFYKYFRHMA